MATSFQGQFNDRVMALGAALGYTGKNYNETLVQLLNDFVTGSQGNPNDAWKEFFVGVGLGTNSNQDDLQAYLVSIGYPQQHVNDMFLMWMADTILSTALDPVVALNGTSIDSTGGNVTKWRNVAGGASSGGTAYDLTPSTGTPTVETLDNGLEAVNFNNNSNMKSAAQQTIAQPCSIIWVGKSNNALPTSGFDQVSSGHSTATSLGFLLIESTNTFRANGASFIDISSLDLDINAHLLAANGASSNYSVYNTTEIQQSGNMGTTPLEYITLGSTNAGSLLYDGWIGSFYVYNRVLTLAEAQAALFAIKTLWTIGP